MAQSHLADWDMKIILLKSLNVFFFIFSLAIYSAIVLYVINTKVGVVDILSCQN